MSARYLLYIRQSVTADKDESLSLGCVGFGKIEKREFAECGSGSLVIGSSCRFGRLEVTNKSCLAIDHNGCRPISSCLVSMDSLVRGSTVPVASHRSSVFFRRRKPEV